MNQHRTPFIKVAWGLIILFVFGIAILQTIPEPVSEGEAEDPTGLVMVQLQGEYLLGFASLLGSEHEIASQASILDTGTVEQRQRYMAFMIALGEPELAKQSALRMHLELSEQNKELTEKQAETQTAIDEKVDGISSTSSKQILKSSLGWFGALLEADQTQREVIESSSERKIQIVGGIFLAIVLAGMLGFVGLIVMSVRALNGSVSSGLNTMYTHHGIYAEVFALWLITFVVFMSFAGIVGKVFVEANTTIAMALSLVAFFGSLVVLCWARIRGISWSQIKNDIGWTKGRGILKETLWGIAGYAMMLPFLGIGVLLVLFLVFIQSLFSASAGSDPFAGTSGGAHPIVLEIANGGIQVRFLLIVLAAVAAPIVEETMFRGVLYRQLRTSSNRLGIVLSISLSVLLTSFLFAAIHPQGWIAIPALMAIATGMNLMREWRGTLLPSMIVHGLSNGLVTTMMIIFLS